MDLKELRKFVKDTTYLPDETILIVQQKNGGQDEALCIEVCTYECGGGLHYSEEDFNEEKKSGIGFDPDDWEAMEEPSVKITMN